MTSNSPPINAYEIAENHLAHDMGHASFFSTLGIAILAGAAGMWGLYETTIEDFSWLDFAAFHVAITSCVGLWLMAMIKAKCGIRDAVFMLIAQATLGALGCFGMIIMINLLYILRRNTKGFMEWYLSLFPDDQKSVGQTLYEHIITGRSRDDKNESITSFSDVLEVGTPAQKQTILALIARNFRPELSPVLRSAMNDADATVRVMAATAAARIETSFLEKVMDLKQKTVENPNSYTAWLNKARLYDDYAFTGILDIDRENENRVRAHDTYQRCHMLKPDDATPMIALGRLALRSSQFDEAIAWFDKAHAYAPERADITVWLIEAVYENHDYDKVRQLALSLDENLDDISGLSEDVKRSIRLWRGDAS